MNFDNLMLYDLMTGLYRFIPFLLILLVLHWLYSPHYVIQYVKEFKIDLVETVSQKSSVKIVTYVKRSRDQKVKRKGERLNNSHWEDDVDY